MTLFDEGLFLQPSCRPGILTLTVSWQSHHARRTVSPVPSLSPWPAHVILTFGWRSLNVNLPLSADHGRFAEYLVNENTLKDCGLLKMRPWTYPLVEVTAVFPAETHRLKHGAAVVLYTRTPFSLSLTCRQFTSSLSSVHILDRSQRDNIDETTDSVLEDTSSTTNKFIHDSSLRQNNDFFDGNNDSSINSGERIHENEGDYVNCHDRYSGHDSEMRCSSPDDYFLDGHYSESGWGGDGCFTSLRRCLLNICGPCYHQILCLWHVGRSTPKISLFALGIAVSAVILSDYNLALVESELDAVNLHVREAFFDTFRSFLLLLILVDAGLVLLSALLTGTTREYFCDCISSGVFEFGQGQASSCFICAGFLRRSGLCLLWVGTCAAMGCTCVSVLIIYFATCASFTLRLAEHGCDSDSNDNQNLDAFIDLINGAVPYTKFDNFDPEKFCNHDIQIRQHVITILVSSWALLIIQALFFTIMVDNRRVAQREQAIRLFQR